MPHYLVANYLPDDFDPSTVTEAMIEEIHALNRELIAAGHGWKVTTGQKAPGQRILQPQGWHPNCEGTVQLPASRRQRARVDSMVSICKFS